MQALALPFRPNNVHETQAQALTALGRLEDAREAYRLFLRDAAEYGLHEYRAEERHARARVVLQS